MGFDSSLAYPTELVVSLQSGAVAAMTCCLIRILVACDLEQRLTRSTAHANYFWLVPVKDLLQAAIWFCAFAGNTVEWRGRKMRLRPDGTLIEEK
jgi:ceramide glucosyltransferase